MRDGPAAFARGPSAFGEAWTRATLAALAVGILAGCAGPALLRNGRATYNEVINRTEDEQVLSMIVRQRYDETYGLLAVSSVTASLRVGASLAANAGVGPGSNYEGNLVPLGASATYEENPTISYVPLRGEQFLERMLAPISAEQTLLLARLSTAETEVLRVLVRRANGLLNPVYASTPPTGTFDRFVDLFASLREDGVLDVTRGDGGAYEVLLHDTSPQQAARANELLEVLGIHRTAAAGTDLHVPLRFYVGSARRDGIDLETPSALEVIEAAGLGVELPDADVAEGVVRSVSLAPSARFLTVHTSSSRPDGAAVAIEHRGSWFFIDARDARSKQAFLLLRTLIGLRLDETAGQQAVPMLTLPVSR